MDTTRRDYSALRKDHAQAKDAFDRHLENPQGVDAPPDQQPQRNYGMLKEDHARALDALNAQVDRAAEPSRSDRPDVAPEIDPTRPTELRVGGWTDRGGMAEQQASALAWVKDSHQRRAREALDRHIEEARTDRTVDTPDADLNHAPGVNRSDGVER